MINGSWEQVKDLSDVLREEIFEDNEFKIEELEIEILELRLKEDCLKNLNKKLDILENYIDENKDGTDYMKGMEKAYEIIER